ncbi:hypothetical protein COBT_000449 [Conglomerata obtusa]
MEAENDLSKLTNIEVKYKQEKANMQMHNIITRQLNVNDSYPINIYEIRNFSYYGFITKNLRPSCWKLFLGYFNKNKFKHELFLKERRKFYLEYCEKAIKESINNPRVCDVINDDVDRTYIEPHFIKIDDVSTKKCKILDASTSILDYKTSNRDVVKRILLTYKITNTSIGYVQGMVSLLVPIYYVFKYEGSIEDNENAEADSFFCFFYLMSEIGEHFVESMDNDQSVGINDKTKKVLDIVERLDNKLFERMKYLKLTDYPFHFKWVALNMAQEFRLHECIWLWDKFLSDSLRFELVLFCCAATIMQFKEFIMKNSFEDCMELLQKENKTDPEEIFNFADKMRRKYNSLLKKDKK